MTRSPVEDVWPLSPLQEGLLFHAAFDDQGPDVYTVQSTLALEGPLDEARLRATWAALLDRHAALRACFRQVSGARRVQVIARHVTLPWRTEDLSRLPGAEARAALERLAEQERAERFDLAKAPLLRVLLVRLAAHRHRLVLTSHHILMDGWSAPVLVAELTAAYAHGGDTARLPRTTSYRDYLLWLGKQDKEAARAAWRAEFDGAAEPTLVAPAVPDRPPAFPGHVGGDLPPALGRGLTELARTHGLTVNTVAQGAWALVLARLAGRTDVVFGATVAGRPAELPGVESMVGLLINTLPVRVPLDGAQPAVEMLRRLQERQTALLAHQHLGLLDVKELAGPGAVFDTLMVYESFPRPPAGRAPDPGALTIRPHGFAREAAHYPLTLVVAPGERTHLKLEYRTDLFDRATAEAAHAGLVRALEQLVADPGAPVGSLRVTAPGRPAGCVTPGPAPGRPVPALIAARAAASPRAVALLDGERTWSYGELWDAAGRLAAHLAAAGVARGDRVAVVLDRSADVVVALLAVWRAGAAYVPVDPGHPVERIATVLADSGTRAVVCGRGTRASVPPGPRPLVVLDDPAVLQRLAGYDGGPAVPVTAGETAYVMYTSGSTGAPKGVAVPHGAVAALVGEPGWRVGPDDTVLLHAPHAFDAFLFEAWVPLAAGGRVLVAGPGVVDAREIRRYTARGVTTLHLTAGTFRVLAGETPACFTGLREVLTGGDVVPAEAVARVRAACPDVAVRHMYGPTETTLCFTWHPVGPGDEHLAVLPVGRPLPGRQAYVLDAFLQPVPPGATGELYLAGPSLAHGYWRAQGPTAERFVACPFPSGTPGARMYRTGDLARRTADGELVFVGRADAQVKIRGFRVELGEVEAALAAHPDVAQAVAVARDDGPGGRRLVGYVVPSAAAGVDPQDVREHAAKRLPPYMVPAAVLTLGALPVTRNGKVDHAALPAPDFAERVTGGRPRTAAEETLCRLFAEVLDLQRVGSDDNFFDLGGDSGLAMRLAGRIREEFDAELPIRQFFGAPTPAGVARLLATKARPVLAPAPDRGDAPVTAGQLRTWLLARLDDESGLDRVPVALRLSGDLDQEALRSALADVAARHDVLRTLFPGAHGGELRQQVQRADAAPRPGTAEPPFLTVAPADEAGLPELIAEHVRRPFDLARHTPWTRHLFTLSDTEHVLLLVLHRIAADDASLEVLLRDLATAYGARREGRVPERAPLPVQFTDYAHWERELLDGESRRDSLVNAQLAHWRAALAGTGAELVLPADRPRPPVASHRAGTVPLRLDPEAHARVADVAEEAGTTVFTVVHAALALLLSRLGAGDDITVGTLVPRRDDPGLEGVVGPFVGPLALRTDVSGDPTFGELVGRARESYQEAAGNRDVPFERLIDALDTPPSLARHPVFQVLLDVRDSIADAWDLWELPGVRSTRLDTGAPATELDLSVELTERYLSDGDFGGLEGRLRYAAELFDEATADAFARRLVRVLHQAVADPEVRLGAVDVFVDEAERARAGALAAATVEDPRADTVPRLFAERAASDPGAVAVVDQRVPGMYEASMTYGTLDAAADGLARRLTALGAGPERVVVVAVPPTLTLVVALLGVLKAGAACRFADPARPVEPGEGPRPAALVHDATAAAPVAAGIPLLALDDPASGATEAGAGPGRAEASGPGAAPGGGAAGCAPGEAPGDGAADSARTAPPNAPGPARPLHPDHPALVLGAGATVLTHRALTARASQAPRPGDPVPLDSADPPAELAVALLAALCAGAEVRLGAGGAPAAGGHGTPETGGTWLRLAGAAEEGTAATGHPVDPARARVLDDFLRPVPPGATGDLYVAGPVLARGYADRPAATGERFVADPHGTPGTRMFRTGDRARWTATGELALRRAPETAGRRRPGQTRGDLDVLLPLRPEGSRPPLFCLHPGMGLSWGYAALLPYLPADVPLYGIQARGLARPERLPGSIEEMAADYAEEIRTVQPTGPYHLLGWSVGGTLAQAVATRLEELGEEVALLALLDAYPHSSAKSRLRGENDQADDTGSDGYALLKRDEGGIADLYRSTGLGAQPLANLEKVLRNMAAFTPTHTPRPFGGDLLLFVATEDRPDDLPAAAAADSWRPYVQGAVRPYDISAGHYDMLKPGPLSHVGRVVTETLRIHGNSRKD
ncbi:Linear gramicidin synthase subunit D [Streptomyces sp. YIM 121038]|uniref:amino acid adenylation domain-containing protein n=1 Tax=Streptomyces sp. YIM 121038 TaxID=2136401 RepID=UPI0011109F4E|nr:non-ribosomal peptide synthetase [Streptomyces sp. YIM 121038]QCX74845.1 Linear gramicidin synthase subunit D [Streptomyces sp. YIM 121038]